MDAEMRAEVIQPSAYYSLRDELMQRTAQLAALTVRVGVLDGALRSAFKFIHMGKGYAIKFIDPQTGRTDGALTSSVITDQLDTIEAVLAFADPDAAAIVAVARAAVRQRDAQKTQPHDYARVGQFMREREEAVDSLTPAARAALGVG